MDERIKHLTRTPWRFRAAARIDEHSLAGWLTGTFGAIWIPVAGTVVVTCALPWLNLKDYTIPVVLVAGALQLIAGCVAHGAKRYKEVAAGPDGVLALQRLLDWMQDVLFRSKNTRITVMVPVECESGVVLRVFLRPSDFPLDSKIELSVNTNTGHAEGIAGVCYQEGSEQRVALDFDPVSDPDEYARLTHMPREKVDLLNRKARFYLAHPIEDKRRTGRLAGILMVDNLTPGIMDDTDAACARAEEQTRILVQWIAHLLQEIPPKIRERER